MVNSPDRCYFCGTLSQYNFFMRLPMCGRHWDMMYSQDIPDYIPDSQILNYQKMALVKKLKGDYDS